MADAIRTIIAAVLSNFTVSFLVLGWIVSAVAIARAPKPVDTALVVEKLLSWYVFFSIGVCYALNFVFHVFYGAMAASFIGWADSPFQLEVGMASLGFSAVGLLAAWGSFDLRLAAVLGFGIFTLGAAAGHVYQMVTAHNFAPGNSGLIFYTDLAIPAFGFALLWMQHREMAARTAKTTSS